MLHKKYNHDFILFCPTIYLTTDPNGDNLIIVMARQNKESARRWNILIAEDDLASRALLLKALSRRATCTVVENGEQAMETYRKAFKKKKAFDFILLDVTMPVADGFEVLRSIRKEEEEKNLTPSRIIMITAYKDSLMEHYNMGWDEYITKPVDTDRLIEKLEKLST
ncbi:MAG TPA: response regulator [Candidatus Omnitrophota bacterium]|nr:response regulator [Candidatus Omnitrophota bacterium]HPD84369.1 response regulator [Candidatus Omnitrophota bacterium]HRZ03227.1 response regulator [Candidatus Omnitrophota bacterium]